MFEIIRLNRQQEADRKPHPIEIKKTASPSRVMAKHFNVLDKSLIPRGTGAIVCACEKVGALGGDTLIIPAGLL